GAARARAAGGPGEIVFARGAESRGGAASTSAVGHLSARAASSGDGAPSPPPRECMGTAAARLVLTVFLGTLFATAAAAQLGHVVGAQKISDTSGGFTAQLDEEDQFGRSIVNLGDLDGDGVTDLLVGAHTDDDGGIDQGAVYILFMRSNGWVKSWT